MTLEHVYYWSQIVLTGIAFAAAGFAFFQLETFKKFELVKVLESENVREARRLLYKQLRDPGEPKPNWWKDNTELEKAASTVCASFDIVGIMAGGSNRRFFVKEWANPICWTYEVLETYVQQRSPPRYRGYRKLYQEAKKHHQADRETPMKPKEDTPPKESTTVGPILWIAVIGLAIFLAFFGFYFSLGAK